MRSKSSLGRRNILVGSSALAAAASHASPVRRRQLLYQPYQPRLSGGRWLSLYSERNTLSSPVAIVLSVARICPDEVSR
jgi:hypothetical protein